MSGFAETMT